MFYYNIWVRSNQYKSKKALTYGSDQKISTGQIVNVELRNEAILGFVSSPSEKPRFKTKKINYVLESLILPKQYLKLADWIKDYYFASIGDSTRLFLPQYLKPNENIVTPTKTLDLTKKSKLLDTLTHEQTEAIGKINAPGTYLLHGRTGSGKTRLYLELSIASFKKGLSSLILTPEISLTSQLYQTFKKIFGESVILVHSKLSPNQKEELWLRCLKSQNPLVIIGPRSALFYPLQKIGLIVIDECHETSYKSDQTPKYQALRVASYLSKLNSAILIMGSATPNVADYYIASERHIAILKMNRLAKNNLSTPSNYQIVDLKDRTSFTKSKLISNKLLEAINQALKNKRQTLIYLNRRGTARLILCDQCGWEAICPKCNLPMAYHQDKDFLICHTCGLINKTIPKECPICKNISIIYKSAGTKAVEAELNKLFPSKKIVRFDSDNLKSERIDQNLADILSGKIEILIGTQLLAKGFDLPNLSLVGLIQSDTSLYIPDFTSQERTFQLISQVIGRINRGHIEGSAIIQTYNPESVLLKSALDQDYETFFAQELQERKTYQFPPFFYLLKLSVRKKTPESAEKNCLKVIDLIKSSGLRLLVEGPAPSFHERINNQYSWQIIIKSKNRNELIKALELLPNSTQFDIDPINLL